VELKYEEGVSWFNSEVARNVGNGSNTSFWNVIWRGNTSFRLKYPILYSIYNQRDAVLIDEICLCGRLRGVSRAECLEMEIRGMHSLYG